METRISSAAKEIIISDDQPTVLIGERINPAGRKKLATALQAGDIEFVRGEAIAQVQAGADILDVNVSMSGVDQITLLPQVVQVVMEVVDVPLSLDSDNAEVLEAALKIYRGKPIINSVTGQEHSLNEILPLVKEYGTAVIGLAMDDDGIPADPDQRVVIAHKIVERAEALGIPRQDIIIDCLALTVAADGTSGLITLQAVREVHAQLELNQTLGASNISYGLPDRGAINEVFLALAIDAGVTCPTVDVAKVHQSVLAIDLILARDRYAQRYIKAYRQR